MNPPKWLIRVNSCGFGFKPLSRRNTMWPLAHLWTGVKGGILLILGVMKHTTITYPNLTLVVHVLKTVALATPRSEAIFWCILLPEINLILRPALQFVGFLGKRWSSRNKATQEISTLCDSIIVVCCIFLDVVDSCHGIHLKFIAESTKMSETSSSRKDGLLHLFCWHYPLCGDHCIAGATDCGGEDIA